MVKDKEALIIEAATAVFLRYGFRRTTMGDLAQASGLSRPALYLRYCNKETIFQAVLSHFVVRTLEEIKSGLPLCPTPLEQLRFAFECWAVRPFQMMQGSPDARDLASCSLAFAETTMAQSYAAFETILGQILTGHPAFRDKDAQAVARVAHVLAVSAKGFKAEAQEASELKGMMETLLGLVLMDTSV
jgi:AcrR family transcriptional regulator